MKILLTGATGFLGYRTLEKMVEDDSISKIIANGRTLKDSHHMVHPKVEYQLGDLSNPSFVDSIVKGVHKIVHAAALSSPFGSYSDFEKANLTSQINLINSAKKFGIERFVFISTPGVYFEFRDRISILESDQLPTKMVNHYAHTKMLAERELVESELNYVILRPRALIGRGDTVILPRMIRAQKEGRLRIVGNGNNQIDLTPVSNVADATLLALHAGERASRQIFNVANGAPVKLWDTISEVLVRLDFPPPKKRVSIKVALFAAGLQEWIALNITKREPVLTRYGVGVLGYSHTLDISKAKDLLGYEPKLTVADAIDEFIKEYQG